MATALSMSCPICMDNFNNSDTIYNTSCGHIFHYNCIQRWRLKSANCPVCRVAYVTMQRLFLNFDEHVVKAEEKVKKMEQQLKQLSIDKMALQSLVDQQGAKKKEPSPRINSNTRKQKQQSSDFHRHPVAFPPVDVKVTSKNSIDQTRVLVKRLPNRHLRYPLIDSVKALTAAMGMKISDDDVHYVGNYANNRLPNTVSLLIQFRTLQLKINFLKNKSKLKNHPEYGSVFIHEYMDEDTYSLFHYAKTKLKDHGFFKVFCQNGQIMAADSRSGRKPIHIKNKAQVDDIICPETENKNQRSFQIIRETLSSNGTDDLKPIRIRHRPEVFNIIFPETENEYQRSSHIIRQNCEIMSSNGRDGPKPNRMRHRPEVAISQNNRTNSDNIFPESEVEDAWRCVIA
uniref:RING-type domain-containing protein n=1 Tax=Glossina pallidipes TaxID=7398 RepID=A0A1B0A2S8_GLOPL